MPSLKIRLLGGFEIISGSRALPKLPTQKIQSLFAYLVIHRDRSHPREVLSELFWAGMGADRARSNLRHSLYVLRQWVNGFVKSDRFSVGINARRAYSLDTREFQDLVISSRNWQGSERFAALQRALQLYRGDLLPGFYDDWVVSEDSRLKELYQEVATTLSQLPHARSGKAQSEEISREADLKMELAKAHHQVKRMEPAYTLAAQALQLYGQKRDPVKQAESYILMGSAQRHLGQYQIALDCYHRALHLSQEAKDARNTWRAHNNLGWLEWNLENSHGALNYYRQALPLCRSLGDLWGEAVILNNTGIAHLDLKNYKRALSAFAEAQRPIATLGDKELRLENLSYQALAHIALKARDLANDCVRRVLELLQQGVGARLSHKAHLNLWRVLRATKHKEQALRHLEWAYENVMTRASKITTPELKQSFLAENRSNREILEAWGIAKKL